MNFFVCGASQQFNRKQNIHVHAFIMCAVECEITLQDNTFCYVAVVLMSLTGPCVDLAVIGLMYWLD